MNNAPDSRPLVSVTMTNYNYAGFLPRAIESILEQDFRDYELLIIDNASSDESLAVIRGYDDPRIRLVAHDQNQGALASFRESCALAVGTYRLHVDADDWILRPDAIGRQVQMLESHPDMAFAFSAMTLFDQNDEKSWVSRPHSEDTVLTPAETLEDILGFNFGHSGLMFRLDLYRQTDGYPDDMSHIDDLVLAVRLAELGTVGYLNEELYAFRQHGGNIHLSPGRSVMQEQILPLIDEAFAGDLAARLPEAQRRRLHRHVEQRALVHGATAAIFINEYRTGWTQWFQSFRARPIRTALQPRTLSLLARTVLGSRLFDRLVGVPSGRG